jgi:hypothetical protein
MPSQDNREPAGRKTRRLHLECGGCQCRIGMSLEGSAHTPSEDQPTEE